MNNSHLAPTALPRAEYPRPQFRRDDWLCLNGQWGFEIDAGDSGLDRGLPFRELNSQITVPFCPESKLSGVEHLDFMNAVWYRREVTIPTEWQGRHAVLHFGAVDYDATVWAGRGTQAVEIGRHRGGFTPFSCELKDVANAGETFTLVVRARDFNKESQPRGKQSDKFDSHSCFYTRTTGIWQTVWLEPLHEYSMKRARITPDVANACFRIEQPLSQNRRGLKLRATLKANGEVLNVVETRADLDLAPRLDLFVPADRVRLWSMNDPFLYDITLELFDDERVLDRVESYAGLRSIALDGQQFKINGESVFQRLVLDQGYYPDGVMTAPTDDALRRDIELAQSCGFNGARLHQKVFEERFLYHADRLGFLVWGEFPDWTSSNAAFNHNHKQPGITFAAQWLEALERDYSHPSIVGWCGFNETQQGAREEITPLDDAKRALFLAAKAMDTSRPVLDVSGYVHRVLETDVFDSHDYILEADFAIGLDHFQRRHAIEEDPTRPLSAHDLRQNGMFVNRSVHTHSVPYRGQPYFVSEMGGFRWNPQAQGDDSMVINEDGSNTISSQRNESWGYGTSPQTPEEFFARFEAVCSWLLAHPRIFGYCYTQLTDIFPEENGLFFFDRTPKFDVSRFAEIQNRKAAIEE